MRKPKCDLSPRVRQRVEYDLEDYPEDKRQLREFKNEFVQQITPNYDAIGHGSGVSNPTESSVMRMCNSAYIRMTEMKVNAIERVLDKLDQPTRKMIELVYWRKSHNVVGAGLVVGMSKSSAYRIMNDVFNALACALGYIDY